MPREPESDGTAPAARRRVFFALWPDEATRLAIIRATRAAVRRCGGRPTPRDNLHVTLAFLGPVTETDLARLRALEPPATAPFELVLDRLGLWARAQVLWIAPTGVPPALLALERGLWDRLVGLGFERDPRPYLPHVTVARKAGIGVEPQFSMARGKPRASPENRGSTPIPIPIPIRWLVSGIALVESRPGPRSPRYDVLESW
jgi:2'-5' RNA ligase